ncbi:MAG: hypothetical protein JWR74_2358 [Polaromonas sp.]|nr:hypothetical protein [Polaromonas sp.]
MTVFSSQHSLPSGMFCKLRPGQALSLKARHAGELRIRQGGVWLTFSQGGGNGPASAGDYFLRAGASLPIGAG